MLYIVGQGFVFHTFTIKILSCLNKLGANGMSEYGSLLETSKYCKILSINNR